MRRNPFTDTSHWNRLVHNNPEYFTCKIKNNLTMTEIEFPVMPQNISESVSSTFNQQEIIGASSPKITYASTSAVSINISLQNLTEDYLPEAYKELGLHAFVRDMQSLAYPDYPQSGIVESPDLTLTLGDRVMGCVCTNVSVSWGNLVKEQQILSCNIDISLLRTRSWIKGATAVAYGG